MKKIIISITALVLLIGCIALYLFTKDPLNGEWISNKGEGFGLVQASGTPFVAVFSGESVIFQNKEYLIKSRTLEKDGRIAITTDKFDMKVKLKEDGSIIFTFPNIGMRKYTKK